MNEHSAGGSNPDDWGKFVSQANDAFLGALEAQMKAQAALVQSWNETMVEQIDDPTMQEETLDSFAEAWDIWVSLSEKQYQNALEGMEEGEFSSEEFRDEWLSAANNAFKEVMGTNAYAAATGNTVEAVLTAQREADAAAQDTLSVLGFATRDDITEVGERLVELERRQHAIENKLDQLLDWAEEQ